MVEAMLAWGTDYHFIYINIAGGGLLVDEAERQGKIVIGTELGGGGHVTAGIHRVTRWGLTNFLRHVGVLAGEVETRTSRGLPDPIILKALDMSDYNLAPADGLFETCVDLGQDVARGQVVGRLHSIEQPDRLPVEVEAGSAGIVCGVRAIASTRQGDCIVVVGQRCSASELA
jgi:predicted deacylase